MTILSFRTDAPVPPLANGREAMFRVYEADAAILAPLERDRNDAALLATLALVPLFTALGAKSYLAARLGAEALGELAAGLAARLGAAGAALEWLVQPDPVTGALTPLVSTLLG